MYNTRNPRIRLFNTFATVCILGLFLSISACNDDGGNPPPPGIDVDALKQSAVVSFADEEVLNLVGVTKFTTGLGNGYTFDQSAASPNCSVESSYIGIPDLGAIWANGFTVAGWVNFSENRKFERIIDLGKDTGGNIGENTGENGGMNVTFSRRDESNDLALTSWISTDGAVNKSTGRLTAENVIVNGTTQFYVATISPSGEMAIFVNGMQAASKSDGHPVENTERTSNFLGRSNWCYYDLDFKGSMSGIWVFNKVLSNEEITALYEDGVGKL